MQHADLTEAIIGCAFKVAEKMKFGYIESVYEKCMLIELRKAGLSAEFQVPIKVYYDEVIVGDFTADIVVEGTVIVELKSARRIVEAHEVQLVNYLTATRKPVGLLVNFGPSRVDIKRKVKDL